MNLNGLTRGLSRLAITVKQSSPTIIRVASTVSIAAGAVWACKQTLKADELLSEAKNDIDKCKEVAESHKDDGKYSDKDLQQAITKIYVRTGLQLCKLYAGPITLIGGGVFGFHWVIGKLNKDLACASAAAATYASINDKIKKNVITKYGEEAWNEVRHGLKTEEVEYVEVDENGKQVKKKEKIKTKNDTFDTCSDYSKIYDRINAPSTYTDNPFYNKRFLLQQQGAANERLKSQGYLFLNDVYYMLGINDTLAGSEVGWIYDPEGTYDNYISFGLETLVSDSTEAFMEGRQPEVLLDFNVDGPIRERLFKKGLWSKF